MHTDFLNWKQCNIIDWIECSSDIAHIYTGKRQISLAIVCWVSMVDDQCKVMCFDLIYHHFASCSNLSIC
jgi:hypothetical protein